MNIRVLFAIKDNHGSDREVGWQCYSNDISSDLKYTYIIESEDASSFTISQSSKITIQKIPFDYMLRIIPRSFRYLIWLQFVQLWCLLNYRKIDSLSFVTFTQIISPIWIQYILPTTVGPLGTIGYAHGQQSLKLKLKSFFIWKIFRLIPLIFLRGKKLTVAIIHPSLKKFIPHKTNTKIISALDSSYIKYKDNNFSLKKNLVISVGRDVSFKNLDLVRNAFKDLSMEDDNKHEFILINSSHSEILSHTNHFKEHGRLSRDEVLFLMSKASLHVMPSFELAGFVALEAALSNTPTLSIKKMGACHMLSPSNNFLIEGSKLNLDELKSKIRSAINNKLEIRSEGERQKQQAIKFLNDNRELYIKFRKMNYV